MENVKNVLTDFGDGIHEGMGLVLYGNQDLNFESIHDAIQYTTLGNEVKPCYFASGDIYAYLYNGQATIHNQEYDSTVAKVQRIPLAFEVHNTLEGRYYFGGINDSSGVGHFALGSSSPSIAASGVVNALGMFVNAQLYDNNAEYWGKKLSETREWQSCKMMGGNTIPLLVDYNTKVAYIPEEFAFCCAKMIANEKDDWTPTGYKQGSYEFMGWSKTPKFKALHGEATGRDTDEYDTSGGLIYIDQGGYACVVSKTPLSNVRCHLKYTRGDGTVEDYYKTVNVTEHVTGTGYDYYTSGVIENWWRCFASDVKEKYPITNNYYNTTDYYDKLRYISALVNGIADYGDLPTNYSVIPNAVIPTMNDIKNYTDSGQFNYLVDRDMSGWFGNSIQVRTLRLDSESTNLRRWYPIAIPYNFTEPLDIGYDPNSFYDTTRTPLGDSEHQIWDGGVNIYTEDNRQYITNNIYGPSNYYYTTYNITPSGDAPVEPTFTTGGGLTMPDVDPPSDDADSGIGGVYIPTRSELQEFNYWLYNDTLISWDKFLTYFGKPQDAIVGLHQIYVPTNAMETSSVKAPIQCGFLTAQDRNSNDLKAYKLEKRYAKLYMGHVYIQEHFGNVFDYAPYTNIQLFLPFVGFVTLPVSKVMRGDVECICNVDCVSGAILYQINVTRDGKKVEIASYGGCTANQYPTSSGTYSNLLGCIVGAVGGAVTGLVSRGLKHAVGGMLSGAVGGVASNIGDSTVSTSGGYGASTGAMGRKSPYIVIERSMPNMPTDYNRYTGNPFSKTVKLGSCIGLTRCDKVHLDEGDMTYQEKEMILKYLHDGVVF